MREIFSSYFGKSESMYIALFLQINSISNFTMFFTHQPSNPTPKPPFTQIFHEDMVYGIKEKARYAKILCKDYCKIVSYMIMYSQ